MAMRRKTGARPSTRPGAAFETVSAEVLHCFSDLVRRLGGDPDALLRCAALASMPPADERSTIEYRSVVELLRAAAQNLACRDFGLRLAALQDSHRALGPVAVVLRNCATVGEAIRYCTDHTHAYSLATRASMEPFPTDRRLLRVDILPHDTLDTRQMVEYALLLGSRNVLKISGGGARARGILFRHEPLSALDTYRAAFGCDVSFGQSADGIVFGEEDLRCPVAEPDSWAYEMAASYIEAQYPRREAAFTARVRELIQQSIGRKECTCEQMASTLHLHPRTLQRRLRDEGASFDGVKDEVRRELAGRYILRLDMPLGLVAEKLGYSEASVLTRSCYRWFRVSPRQLRAKAAACVDPSRDARDGGEAGSRRRLKPLSRELKSGGAASSADTWAAAGRAR